MKRLLSLFAGLFLLLSSSLPVLADGGITVKKSSGTLVFLRAEDDASGNIVSTGTTTLTLLEVQDDGTLKTYDFADNTFKATAVTTLTASMANQSINNNASLTGIWSYSLATLTGFTKGKNYIAVSNNALASPVRDRVEFQFGGADGDITTDIKTQTDKIGTNNADSPNAVTAQGNAATAATQATQVNTKGTAIQAKTDLLPTWPTNFPSMVIGTDGKVTFNNTSIPTVTGSVASVASAVTLPVTPPTGYGNQGYFYAPVTDSGSTSTLSLTLTVTNPTSSATSRLLTWTADSGATGYKVFRSADGVTFTVIATLGSSATTYTDTTRPSSGNVTYFIRSLH